IRNDAYDRWRDVLAEAAGTDRERVLVASVHQHDTPLADLEAQRILQAAGAGTQLIDLQFHERSVQQAAANLRQALPSATVVTHIGTGQAKVARVASNRRFLNEDGSPNYGRYSGGGNPAGRSAPEGTIDPMLKTITFWNGETLLAALNSYSTHPMSYYRTGRISADFPGLARARRQAETPGALQIYASGASGNVTAGKYNSGKPEMRQVLADRLYRGMKAASMATRKQPLREARFRVEELNLDLRESPGFLPAEMAKSVGEGDDRVRQGLAALGLSWRKRVAAGQAIDVPLIDFGTAQLLLLPAEMYVEYQLYAQSLRPESFVMVIGYGECAPGYLPIERAWKEGDQNLGDWCWIAPGMEPRIKRAIRSLLSPDHAKHDRP
ncbi:MAG: hypothetical protein GWO24_37050, partial [Akkermansiaceae bacterium]|nr:hypothetical protein [Akkermansiaceae bacterium]